MACTCSHEPAPIKPNSKFRTALWIALVINLSMFFIELIGGAYAHSSSLWADSLDFFGDAVNYGISLAVLSASLYWRATVALVKGITMATTIDASIIGTLGPIFTMFFAFIFVSP